MSKLTITEAVKVIPVSESTLRRDLKSGKISFDTDGKNRKQIDVSELTRVYGKLKPSNGTQPPASKNGELAEPVNDTPQNPSMTENAPPKSSLYWRTRSRISRRSWRRPPIGRPHSSPRSPNSSISPTGSRNRTRSSYSQHRRKNAVGLID